MEKSKLPLRIGVGIVVLNEKNQVFVGKRKDNPINKWQMPQGGVDEKEDLLSAMKRELEEETSIKNIKIIKELDYWMEYELPKELIGIIWKGKYRGQKQKWFITRFLGEEKEINLNTKHKGKIAPAAPLPSCPPRCTATSHSVRATRAEIAVTQRISQSTRSHSAQTDNAHPHATNTSLTYSSAPP